MHNWAYWRQDGHAAHAGTCTPAHRDTRTPAHCDTCTPAHSDTSRTLTCEEPVNGRVASATPAVTSVRGAGVPTP